VGNLSGYTYPNGVQSSYLYNSLNRLTSMSVSSNATQLASYSYTLGAAGNRLSVMELSGRQVAYTYDDLYRLKSETISNDPITSNNGSISYAHDAVGNRLSRSSSIPSVPSTTSSFDANDRLSSDGYDPNGNTTLSNGNAYSYDFENRLVAMNAGTSSAVTISYDGDGNRVSKSVGGITTRYLVDTNNPTGYAQVVEELAAVGGQPSVARVYVYGNDLISQQQVIDGDWSASFYGYDGHGSVRLLTDSSDSVTDTYTYDAFGILIDQTGSTPNDYLYAGEQRDSSLGLDYLRARYMNPATGRFWSQDSFEGGNSDPSFLHKYLYANADPINKSDPSGHFAVSTADTAALTQALSIILSLALLVTLQTILSTVQTDIQEKRNDELCKKGGGIPLYRSMKSETFSPWTPKVEQSARGLGVRESIDITPDFAGYVYPLGGGLSIAPNDPKNLPSFRKPILLGGTSRDPLFCINSSLIYATGGLLFRQDSPTHGLIEPNSSMTLDTFREKLAETQYNWLRVLH